MGVEISLNNKELMSDWISEKDWKFILTSMPLPCVDVIVKKRSKVLMGFRAIEPYKNVWALPGGRILKSEHPEDTVRRILKGINVDIKVRKLVGIFPVRFPRHPQKRYDITLCYQTDWIAGEPKSDEELIKLKWFSPKSLPKQIGGNHKKMIYSAFKLGAR